MLHLVSTFCREKLFFSWRFRRRLSRQVLRLFEINSFRYFTTYQIAYDLGVATIRDQCILDAVILRLVHQGKIEQVFQDKFRLRCQDRFTGVIDMSIRNRPRLISGNCGKPVYVLPNDLQGACHGDTVSVKLCRRTPYYSEARVLRILVLAQRTMVGRLEILETRAYCIPLSQSLFCDIEVPFKYLKKAQDGDCVVIRFLYGKPDTRRIYGKVIQILGDNDLPTVKKRANFHLRGFSAHFNKEEEEAAAAIDFKVKLEEIIKREDMRDVMTFTIDPRGCKDIDDALSIRLLKNGNYEIGVHIADVSYYLEAGSLLDKQAYQRTTAVYLANAVLTMFPVSFVYGCSLFPQEDKLALSVIFEMDHDAKIIHRRIVKTVIRSQRQFDYEEAQKLIDNPEDTPFSDAIVTLFDLSQKLRKRRFANGAIIMKDSRQCYFEFDDNRDVTDVRLCKNPTSMALIEEFMLLANRTIAETMAKKHIPFVYRSHASPQTKTFDTFCDVADNYGYQLTEKRRKDGRNRATTKKMQHCLSQTKTPQEESLFTNLAVRSMAQAKYSNVPRRHFALSFNHYTHFTSPIRRYVDIIVHRIIAREILHDHTVKRDSYDYEDVCRHLNRMREQAKHVQRSSVQQKCAEFLRHKVGQVFEGVIVYINSVSIEVELDKSGIRGEVRLRNMPGDRYRLNYTIYAIEGERSGKCYHIGDHLRLRLVYIDTFTGMIEFSIANSK
ncbi:MAG: VacB/RNase II family 3'-5' exoribonuclease [Candidatus Symbiothrix sp.]|nr:VacB/RNase II family 3'-5' exoribonuclease [Candidatus Symbiothrix sp.]